MNHMLHLYTKCPLLQARMQADGREGTFDWDWPTSSWNLLHYLSSLAGRPVRREENVVEVLDELERKLTQEALTV